MMEETANIIRQLAAAGVEVYLSNEKLKARALKGTLDPFLVELIKNNKTELVEYLSQQLAADLHNKRPEIIPLDRSNNEFVPSFSQQRLWFIDKMDGGSAHYNMPSSVQLSGEFNLTAAEEAFKQIIKRHEVLRTVLIEGKHGPKQKIQDQFIFSISYKELKNKSSDDQANAINHAVKDDAERNFDLSKDLMLRASYLNLSDHEGVLLFNMHHIASDGWSIGILFDEFVKLYKAISTGTHSPLMPLSIQYADYAHWQRSWLKGEVLEKQLLYWDKQLSDLPQIHSLPLDFERPKFQTFNGSEFQIALSGDSLKILKTIALENQATLFMVIHAAFSILLSKFSNTNDIVIGTTVANRVQKELEPLIGFFANTLVLRSDCSGNPNFIDFLSQIKNTNLDAQSNQDVPFEYMVDRLNPKRSTSHSALFQIMFSMNTNEEFDLDIPNINMISQQKKFIAAKFDLTLTAVSDDDTLYCIFEYNADLFIRKSIERLANSFKQLLLSITLNPLQPINCLSVIDEQDSQNLLDGLSGKQQNYPTDLCVHQLFENQVEQTPHQIALQYKDHTLTYTELNDQANRLAYFLLEKDFKADDIIGICLQRSAHLIVAIIAVMKAGLAYLPLDPDHPVDRLNYMIKDSGMKMLLTEDQLINSVKLESDLMIVQLDEKLMICLEHFGTLNPVLEGLSTKSLAYVIYTSGSTGTPKGVMIEQVAFVNFLMAMRERLGLALNSESKWLAVTTVSFDIAGLEIFGPLLVGGQVILTTTKQASEPDSLSQLLDFHDVSLMQATPSTWQMMIDSGWTGKSDFVALTGGEKLPLSMAKSLISLCAETWNCYGPTEATVWSLVQPVTQDTIKKQNIYLGGTLNNYNHYILDQNQSLLPFGAIGELCIGGSSLARGYLNQPQLTDEKFIQNHFSEDESARLYRTGDLVRYTDADEIEFLGRLDEQVKIRGFRIELGEIESQLLLNPLVTSSVVLVREDRSKHKQLVAYITSNSDLEYSALKIAIKQSLQQNLPEYMIPTAIICLESMPLNSNGKIDRNKLPEPEINLTVGEFLLPKNDVEKQLVKIWSELLNLPVNKISSNGNFFELGGHSLLSIRLIAEVRSQLRNELNIREIFEYPILSELATLINSDKGISRPLIKKHEGGRSQIVTSFAQQRLWFIDQIGNGNSSHYNMSSAVRLRGDFRLDIAQLAIVDIIERHEPLRTVFVDTGDVLTQSVREQFKFMIKQVDLTGLDHDEQNFVIEAAIEKDASGPFNLSQDLMLRVSYLKVDAQEGVMLFNMHHIASDGWSIGVFVREFKSLYCSKLDGKASTLKPLPIQYADYAKWQREWLSGDVLEQQLKYWDHQLADLPQIHSLPLDFDRPKVQTYRGAKHDFKLGLDTLEALKLIAQDNQATLFMMIHATFAVLLSRYSNSHDIVIATPVANRLQKELEPLIGFFVNTLVLRSDCSDNPLFLDFLEQIKDLNLDAQANQDVPFEHLVDRLNPSRSLSHNALFQIMLDMNTNEAVAFSLPDVEMTPLLNDSVNAKFDLQLSASAMDEGLTFSFEYNTDLFAQKTIERLTEGFKTLLGAIIKNANQNIAELAIINDLDMAYLLKDLNGAKVSNSNLTCMHQMFEQQVIQSPDAVAVIYQGQSLSYSELNVKSNQLAHYLLHVNKNKKNRVGVYLERSIELLIAILGIMKSGGSYVALEPSHPQERLSYVIKDANITLLLLAKKMTANISAMDVNSLVLDEQESSASIWQNYDSTNPDLNISLNNEVYTLYTSGSTGQPKGVMITHKGLSNYVRYADKTYISGLIKGSIVSSPLCFDATITTLLTPLCGGGYVELLIENNEALAELHDRIFESDVPLLFKITPSHLDALLTIKDEIFTNVAHQIIVGGEKFSTAVLNKWKSKKSPSAIFVNEYGPTETVVGCSTFTVKDQNSLNDFTASSVPIGKPIHNTQLYVLDNNKKVQPKGAIGELYIGGAGLAIGYLNQRELTDKYFVDHRFNDEHTERLYRTGDLVRYIEDDNLEFIGRIDDQVKIRGFRIESGEVEFHLSELPQVNRSVVLIEEDQYGKKQLSAYVILNEKFKGQSAIDERIKSDLKSFIPSYMVPSYLTLLDDFPLTPNGKVDNRKLTAMTKNVNTTIYIPPISELEKTLVNVLSIELQLPTENISMGANYFDIGGHSLSLLKVINKMSQKGFDVSLKLFYECENLKEVCNRHCNNESTVLADSLIKLNEISDGSPLYLFHPLGGRADCFKQLAMLLEPLVAVIGVQAPFVSNHDFNFDNLNELTDMYAQAILAHQPEGPYRLGGWSIGGLLAQKTVEFLNAAGKEVEYFVGIDCFMENPSIQKNSQLEALYETLAFVRRETAKEVRELLSEVADQSFEQQLKFAAQKIIQEDAIEISEDYFIRALKFGVDVFKAKFITSKQTISKHATLFIAEQNNKKELLIQGWHQAMEVKTLQKEIEGEHLYLLEGKSLNQIADQISLDIIDLNKQ